MFLPSTMIKVSFNEQNECCLFGLTDDIDIGNGTWCGNAEPYPEGTIILHLWSVG